MKYYAQDMSKQVVFLTQTQRNFKTLDNYDYVDFAYITTDFKSRELPTPIASWILVKDKVTIMKRL